MAVTIHHADNRIILRQMKMRGEFYHGVVTDPPYGLDSIVKRFGKEGSAAVKEEGTDGSFSRLSKNFHGKSWDGSRIERDPEFWKLIHDVILPGGYVFAFSGSRTGHWQAVAMEQAGFIIHPMHVWAYYNGLPKGHDPKVEGFEGWRHGTATQKAALEPVYLAQRPCSEKTTAENIRKHSVGAMNIEDCRIGDRYPTNLLTDGSPQVKALLPGGDSMFHEFPPDTDQIIYHPKAGRKDRRGSDHPTVKPVALLQYLIRHIIPRGGRVLDPFAGSGTTAVAATREGVECTLIEQDEEYIRFLKERFPQATVAHRVRKRVRA